jgi:hypothetical protein
MHILVSNESAGPVSQRRKIQAPSILLFIVYPYISKSFLVQKIWGGFL